MDLSQTQFAERLQVGLASVGRWEAGIQPNTDSLIRLYQLAQQVEGIEAADAALVFIRAGSKVGPQGPEHQTRPINPEHLAWIDDLFASAASRLTRAYSDPKLTGEQRGALVGEALEFMLQGRQCVRRLKTEGEGPG